MKKTLGGERLGSGNKMKVQMHNYERSTHDLSHTWKSSMSAGTLVPFMKLLTQPGDVFDIDLFTEVLTLPTLGPLFGSYKVQLDVFEVPMRLYQGRLHMNELGIGLDMHSVYLPQIALKHDHKQEDRFDDNSQINPSCIFKYLGISGLGVTVNDEEIERHFNAVPYLGYFDIFKQYYSNKQEENAYIIHNDRNYPGNEVAQFIDCSEGRVSQGPGINLEDITEITYFEVTFSSVSGDIQDLELANLILTLDTQGGESAGFRPFRLNGTITYPTATSIRIDLENWLGTEAARLSNNLNLGLDPVALQGVGGNLSVFTNEFPYDNSTDGRPKIASFPLKNIDDMRKQVLRYSDDGTPFVIKTEGQSGNLIPYRFPLEKGAQGWSKQSAQEGLLLKTYQSDIFNNFINTEWIDGAGGINEISSVKIDPNTESFNIDQLNLAYKVYKMLNRIAISGGTYDDYLDAVYTHERAKAIENPVYHGSLIKKLGFQEVVSNSAADADSLQPLGTLAGRGKLHGEQKGGYMKIKTSEMGYLIGIVSLTPYVDYSQGNDFDVNLKSIGDIHTPAMDGIGFQDSISERFLWSTSVLEDTDDVVYNSVGKQPAWLDYMTAVNKCYGNFADENKEMYMTLNRRYETSGVGELEDFTTYIDPTKFNYIFAQSDLTAMNFWVQIGMGITARRKMSAKQIPNL